MNIQVNEHQLERVVIKWLNKHFGNLTQKKHKDYPDSIYYVNDNNQVLMEYDKKTERVYIHNDDIWSKIELLFHLNYGDIQSTIKKWLDEVYKLKEVTPLWTYKYDIHRWNHKFK